MFNADMFKDLISLMIPQNHAFATQLKPAC